MQSSGGGSLINMPCSVVRLIRLLVSSLICIIGPASGVEGISVMFSKAGLHPLVVGMNAGETKLWSGTVACFGVRGSLGCIIGPEEISVVLSTVGLFPLVVGMNSGETLLWCGTVLCSGLRGSFMA